MKKKFLNLSKGIMFIWLFAFSQFVIAQNVAVRGTVTDVNGEVLIGVTVQVHGTQIGTVSDIDGNFTLPNIPSNSTLIITYVGMTPQTFTLDGRTSLRIVMEEDTGLLEEVVVVGYGTQRREAVTGSVASMQGNTMREIPGSNITQALQGRIAGVEMSQTSSQPGAEMQIRVRGTRSLNASNDPLVVLDGIPFAGNISDINPNDIKSIDILKDASSTAIYGSRGANGVVMITTFRGAAGATTKAQVSYNGYQGIRTIFAKYPMMEGEEYVAMRKRANKYQNTLDERDDVNTDWQDLFYQTGRISSHDVGIAGATVGGGYNFGLGFYDDIGIVPTQQYTRLTLRGTFDQSVGKYFRFGMTTNNNYNLQQGSQIGLFGLLSKSPIADPYNEDGTFKRVVSQPVGDSWVYTRETMKDITDLWLSETRGFGSFNTIYGEVSIPWIEGLKYRINTGLNFRMTNDGSYTGRGINNTNPDNVSTASVTNSLTTNWVVENLITYDRTLADVHNFNIIGLYSAEETKYNQSRMSAKDIPADHFQFYNLGQADGEKTIAPGDQLYNISGLMSYMARVMYSYDDRYMVSATVRSDASSRLAPGHKWHTYPAVSLGWNMGQENFMKDITWLDQLKWRVGYGQTSNQAVDPYKTLGLLSTRPYNFGDDTYATGYLVSALPNHNLDWEYSITWNYGIDFSVLNNRLNGSIEYYVQNTKDVLLEVDLPSTSGVNSYWANIGETRNKGFELSLNATILDNYNGFTWEAGVNLYSNKNKLLSLASKQQIDEGNGWFRGYPINAVYDYEYIGLWQEGDPYLDILEPGGNVGMIKVKYNGDYNADGSPVREIGPDDRQIMAIDPDFQGGFNTRLTYKDFDLNVVGTFKSGGLLISTIHAGGRGYLNLLDGRQGNVKVDYWTPENTGAKYPDPSGVRSGDGLKYINSMGYFDASYLKVRTITLGYNFKKKWLSSAGIDRLRLYTTVQNPFVMFSPFHSESGLDPETNAHGNEHTATNYLNSRILIVGSNSPATRNYLVGLNVTF